MENYLFCLWFDHGNRVCRMFLFYERKSRRSRTCYGRKKQEKISVKDGFFIFFHNKYFLLAMALYVLLQFSTQISGSAGTYFFVYVMKDQLLMSATTMFGTIPTAISLFLLVGPCLKYLGKKKSIFLGAAITVVSCTLKLISGITGNVPLLYVSTIIGGFAGGPLNVPIILVLADAVDYGEYKFGKRIEGIGSSTVTFAQKVAVGLTSYAITFVLNATGYVAEQEQPFAVQMGIMGLVAIFPIIIALLMAFLTGIFYDYEKMESEVKEKIEKGK